jgi:glyceraldehyde 3-phosphate dehydrogenase
MNSLSGQDRIVSAASCTTNTITPVLKAINDEFGIVHGHSRPCTPSPTTKI